MLFLSHSKIFHPTGRINRAARSHLRAPPLYYFMRTAAVYRILKMYPTEKPARVAFYDFGISTSEAE